MSTQDPPNFALVTAVLVALAILGSAPVAARMGPAAASFMENLRGTKPNRRDASIKRRGYYEELIAVDRMGPHTGVSYASKPADWGPLTATPAAERVADVRGIRLRPNSDCRFKGARLTTNSHGLRDREYEIARADGVLRVAVLGGSTAMGEGVDNASVFVEVLEERLNRDLPPELPYTRYELLNFAVGGYTAMSQVIAIDDVLRFAPQVLVLEGHPVDITRVREVLANHLAQGRLDVDRMPEPLRAAFEAHQRVPPRAARDVTFAAYREVARRACEHGMLPIYVNVPVLTPETWEMPDDGKSPLTAVAEAGFRVIDLADVWSSVGEQQQLWVAEWDAHPNPRGHTMVAERLLPELVTVLKTSLAAGSGRLVGCP